MDGLPVKAHLLHGAGTEVLDEHIGLFNQLPQQRLALIAAVVDGDTLFVAVFGGIVQVDAVIMLAAVAGIIAPSCLLNLDDLRAQIAQRHAAAGAGNMPSQIQNADSRQRAHICTHRLYPPLCFLNCQDLLSEV